MADRDLPEPSRGLAQYMRNTDRRLHALERTVTKTGASKTQDCPERLFDSGVIGDGGYWVFHTMIEFDIDPGAWLLDGQLGFALNYTGVGILGFQHAHAAVDWRPIGTSIVPLNNFVEFGDCPLADPSGSGAPGLFWRTTIPVGKVVTSETGLTVRLMGQFTWAAGTSGDTGGSDFYLGPGILTATPL